MRLRFPNFIDRRLAEARRREYIADQATWVKLGEMFAEMANGIKWRQEESGGVVWPCVYLLDHLSRPVIQVYESARGVWSVSHADMPKPNFTDTDMRRAVHAALRQYSVYGFLGNRDQSGVIPLKSSRSATYNY